MQNKEHIEKALMMAKKVKKKSKWKAPLIVMVIILVVSIIQDNPLIFCFLTDGEAFSKPLLRSVLFSLE